MARQSPSYRHVDCIYLSPPQNVMVETIRPPTLGARIRARRDELGLTQGELAKRARIRQPSLSDIEGDKTKEITARTLGALCHALGLRWEYALHGTGPSEGAGADGLTREALAIARWFDRLTEPADRALAETRVMAVILRVLQQHDLPPTDKPFPRVTPETPPEPTPPPARTVPPSPAKTRTGPAKPPARHGK